MTGQVAIKRNRTYNCFISVYFQFRAARRESLTRIDAVNLRVFDWRITKIDPYLRGDKSMRRIRNLAFASVSLMSLASPAWAEQSAAPAADESSHEPGVFYQVRPVRKSPKKNGHHSSSPSSSSSFCSSSSSCSYKLPTFSSKVDPVLFRVFGPNIRVFIKGLIP